MRNRSPTASSQAPWELPRCNLKLALDTKGKEKLTNKASHSRLVSGRFNEQDQDNLHMRFVIGGCKIS